MSLVGSIMDDDNDSMDVCAPRIVHVSVFMDKGSGTSSFHFQNLPTSSSQLATTAPGTSSSTSGMPSRGRIQEGDWLQGSGLSGLGTEAKGIQEQSSLPPLVCLNGHENKDNVRTVWEELDLDLALPFECVEPLMYRVYCIGLAPALPRIPEHCAVVHGRLGVDPKTYRPDKKLLPPPLPRIQELAPEAIPGTSTEVSELSVASPKMVASPWPATAPEDEPAILAWELEVQVGENPLAEEAQVANGTPIALFSNGFPWPGSPDGTDTRQALPPLPPHISSSLELSPVSSSAQGNIMPPDPTSPDSMIDSRDGGSIGSNRSSVSCPGSSPTSLVLDSSLSISLCSSSPTSSCLTALVVDSRQVGEKCWTAGGAPDAQSSCAEAPVLAPLTDETDDQEAENQQGEGDTESMFPGRKCFQTRTDNSCSKPQRMRLVPAKRRSQPVSPRGSSGSNGTAAVSPGSRPWGGLRGHAKKRLRVAHVPRRGGRPRSRRASRKPPGSARVGSCGLLDAPKFLHQQGCTHSREDGEQDGEIAESVDLPTSHPGPEGGGHQPQAVATMLRSATVTAGTLRNSPQLKACLFADDLQFPERLSMRRCVSWTRARHGDELVKETDARVTHTTLPTSAPVHELFPPLTAHVSFISASAGGCSRRVGERSCLQQLGRSASLTAASASLDVGPTQEGRRNVPPFVETPLGVMRRPGLDLGRGLRRSVTLSHALWQQQRSQGRCSLPCDPLCPPGRSLYACNAADSIAARTSASVLAEVGPTTKVALAQPICRSVSSTAAGSTVDDSAESGCMTLFQSSSQRYTQDMERGNAAVRAACRSVSLTALSGRRGEVEQESSVMLNPMHTAPLGRKGCTAGHGRCHISLRDVAGAAPTRGFPPADLSVAQTRRRCKSVTAGSAGESSAAPLEVEAARRFRRQRWGTMRQMRRTLSQATCPEEAGLVQQLLQEVLETNTTGMLGQDRLASVNELNQEPRLGSCGRSRKLSRSASVTSLKRGRAHLSREDTSSTPYEFLARALSSKGRSISLTPLSGSGVSAGDALPRPLLSPARTETTEFLFAGSAAAPQPGGTVPRSMASVAEDASSAAREAGCWSPWYLSSESSFSFAQGCPRLAPLCARDASRGSHCCQWEGGLEALRTDAQGVSRRHGTEEEQHSRGNRSPGVLSMTTGAGAADESNLLTEAVVRLEELEELCDMRGWQEKVERYLSGLCAGKEAGVSEGRSTRFADQACTGEERKPPLPFVEDQGAVGTRGHQKEADTVVPSSLSGTCPSSSGSSRAPAVSSGPQVPRSLRAQKNSNRGRLTHGATHNASVPTGPCPGARGLKGATKKGPKVHKCTTHSTGDPQGPRRGNGRAKGVFPEGFPPQPRAFRGERGSPRVLRVYTQMGPRRGVWSTVVAVFRRVTPGTGREAETPGDQIEHKSSSVCGSTPRASGGESSEFGASLLWAADVSHGLNLECDNAERDRMPKKAKTVTVASYCREVSKEVRKVKKVNESRALQPLVSGKGEKKSVGTQATFHRVPSKNSSSATKQGTCSRFDGVLERTEVHQGVPRNRAVAGSRGCTRKNRGSRWDMRVKARTGRTGAHSSIFTFLR